MRTYLALFSHMYLHRWCGCNKKEECVCISHPKEHTPPTVLNSCTAGGGDKVFNSMKST